MVDVNKPGGSTSGAIAVHEPGAGTPLAGPGTSRAVSQPTDARGERVTSRDAADFPVPRGTEEEWRFTPLDRLRGLHDDSFTPGGTVSVVVDAPGGVKVETARPDDPRLGRGGHPFDRVTATACQRITEATVITVPAETVVDEPIVVRRQGEGAEAAAFGHLAVHVEPYGKAVVVLDHTGSATFAENSEFVLADGADLTVVSLQTWADDTVHVGQQSVRVGRDASFRAVTVTLGGDLVRLHPAVTYAGPGGSAELYGLYFADAGQHLEHRLFVDHNAANCRSRVTYKGALSGSDAHTVWIGDVLIRAQAEGTDTYELNRNLVLSDGARADSVPNLEIETGEVVGAGHASATGRFDDEQLFYLQARGIPADEARRLVVRGFFAEVVAQIGIGEIEDRIMAAVDAELAASAEVAA